MDKRTGPFSHVAFLLSFVANKSAWMTSATFEGRLRKWDNELKQQDRKIALYIDNCTAHPHVHDLQSIEIFFLPPNTTEIQPFDQCKISHGPLQEEHFKAANLGY